MQSPTLREDLLSVLRRKRPHRVPCAPHILGINNLPGQLPPALLAQPLDRLAISRFVGGSVFYELSGAKPFTTGDVSVRNWWDENRHVSEIATPAGILRTVKTKSEIATPVYPDAPGLTLPPPLVTETETEYYIKGFADYEALTYYHNHLDYTPDPGAVAEAVERVAEDGVVIVSAGRSPLYALVSGYAGLERTIFDLYDEPDLVEGAMEAILQSNLRQIRALCQTPADIIRITEDLDTSLVSPELFEKYALPALKAYTGLCHAHGKLMVIHMCGRIYDFLPILRETGADGIHCLCPPETGNTPISYAHEVLGRHLPILARVDPPLLMNGTPQALEAAVASMIREADGNLILLLPCGRAPLANLRAVIHAAEHYNEKSDG